MANEPQFQTLSDEERSSIVHHRRSTLERELWTTRVNKVGVSDTTRLDERIEEIKQALAELDKLDPATKQ